MKAAAVGPLASTRMGLRMEEMLLVITKNRVASFSYP